MELCSASKAIVRSALSAGASQNAGKSSHDRPRLVQQAGIDIVGQKHFELADRDKIDIVRRQRTNGRIRLYERFTKRSRILRLWPERGNTKGMRWVELRKELLRGVELANRQNERIEHPPVVQANVARVIC